MDDYTEYNIICISDLHLGSDVCQAESITSFLKQILEEKIVCNELVINGDLFDNLDFRRLRREHWKILTKLRKVAEKIKVVWIVGNHDGGCAETISNLIGVDFVEGYSPQNCSVVFIHGHQFDEFIQNNKVITYIADFLYWCMQKIDPSHKLATFVKKNSKTFMRNAKKIKIKAYEYALKNFYSYVFCGHSHLSEHDSDLRYANSGCWTEKDCTYLEINMFEYFSGKCVKSVKVKKFEKFPLVVDNNNMVN